MLEYLDGKQGFELLAKKYDIIDKNLIREWLRHYKLHGIESLNHTMNRSHYTTEFKHRVIMHRKQHELSYAKTATFFGIDNPSVIFHWQGKYDKYGILGLEPKLRGIPMKNQKRKESIPLSDQEREELNGLRIENERLRAAIAYEKKLQALAQREDRRIPRKRR